VPSEYQAHQLEAVARSNQAAQDTGNAHAGVFA
jgi:hypothetical protein